MQQTLSFQMSRELKNTNAAADGGRGGSTVIATNTSWAPPMRQAVFKVPYTDSFIQSSHKPDEVRTAIPILHMQESEAQKANWRRWEVSSGWPRTCVNHTCILPALRRSHCMVSTLSLSLKIT